MGEEKQQSAVVGTLVFMGAAVVFAGLAGWLLNRLMSARYPEEALGELVVAARDLQAGHPLTAEDLRIGRWPQSSVPRGAFSSIEALLEQRSVPLTSMVAGEALVAGRVSTPHSGVGIAARLKPGQRALALRVDESLTEAKMIYPGARVDLLATFSSSGSSQRARTKTLLQNLTVLAVGGKIDPIAVLRRDKAKEGAGASSGKGDDVVTLAVSAEQAELMTLARREGKIDVVLRSPLDEQRVRTPGATPNQFLGPAAKPRSRPAPAALAPPPSPQPPRVRRRRRRPRRRAAERRGPVIYRGSAG